MSRTNNYTFFHPASMVWRSKFKIGCPTVAVKVEFVKKRTPQNVHYSCHASKKSKPRTIDLFSSLLNLLYVRKAVNWFKMLTHAQKVL